MIQPRRVPFGRLFHSAVQLVVRLFGSGLADTFAGGFLTLAFGFGLEGEGIGRFGLFLYHKCWDDFTGELPPRRRVPQRLGLLRMARTLQK